MTKTLSVEEFQKMIDSSYDGIHITDGNGTTLFYNKACEKIEGNKREDIIGKNMKNLVESGIYPESVTLKAMEKKKTVTMIQRINNNVVLATATPIFDGNQISKVITNSRDITLLNHLYEELEYTRNINKKYHSELELMMLKESNEDIIVRDKKMKKILELALRVAKVDSSVLIQGESGVGKGIISQIIHKHSNRANKPFIKVDCSILTESLIEAELFGYEKGAFTGADPSGKVGLLELADEGTLFLDEIGELPLPLQVKLLSVIQDRKFIRVGGRKEIPINIRIIAATNRNLEEMVEEKKFRKDLYYRLNVVPIFVPPLRERRDDIYPLVLNKLEKVNSQYKLKRSISPRALNALISYDWPGNVRELENIIERLAVTASDNIIEVDQLPSKIKNNENHAIYSTQYNDKSLKQILESFEKRILTELLNEHNNIKTIANILKVDQSTIRRKFKKYNLKIM